MGNGYQRNSSRGQLSCGGSLSSWLDELLCEYVDGTMDRVVRSAFEECLRRDVCLAQQVERLRCMRLLLCRYRCRAPSGLQARILERLQQEMVAADEPTPSRKRGYARAGSVIVALLIAGILAGASWLASPERVVSSPAYVSEVHVSSATLEAVLPREYVYPTEVVVTGP